MRCYCVLNLKGTWSSIIRVWVSPTAAPRQLLHCASGSARGPPSIQQHQRGWKNSSVQAIVPIHRKRRGEPRSKEKTLTQIDHTLKPLTACESNGMGAQGPGPRNPGTQGPRTQVRDMYRYVLRVTILPQFVACLDVPWQEVRFFFLSTMYGWECPLSPSRPCLGLGFAGLPYLDTRGSLSPSLLYYSMVRVPLPLCISLPFSHFISLGQLSPCDLPWYLPLDPSPREGNSSFASLISSLLLCLVRSICVPVAHSSTGPLRLVCIFRTEGCDIGRGCCVAARPPSRRRLPRGKHPAVPRPPGSTIATQSGGLYTSTPVDKPLDVPSLLLARLAAEPPCQPWRVTQSRAAAVDCRLSTDSGATLAVVTHGSCTTLKLPPGLVTETSPRVVTWTLEILRQSWRCQCSSTAKNAPAWAEPDGPRPRPGLREPWKGGGEGGKEI